MVCVGIHVCVLSWLAVCLLWRRPLHLPETPAAVTHIISLSSPLDSPACSYGSLNIIADQKYDTWRTSPVEIQLRLRHVGDNQNGSRQDCKPRIGAPVAMPVSLTHAQNPELLPRNHRHTLRPSFGTSTPSRDHKSRQARISGLPLLQDRMRLHCPREICS